MINQKGFGVKGFTEAWRNAPNKQVFIINNLSELPGIMADERPGMVVFKTFGWFDGGLTTGPSPKWIAGQTSPGQVGVRRSQFSAYTSNQLVEHLNMAPGGTANIDAMTIQGSSSKYIENVVFNHCSFRYGPGENISAWKYFRNASILNSIITEPVGARHGLIIGHHVENLSVIGNLLANIHQRAPFIHGISEVVLANNLIYNVGGSGANFPDAGGGNTELMLNTGYSNGPHILSIVNNVYKKGPRVGAPGDWTPIWMHRSMKSDSQVYLQGNDMIRGLEYENPADQWNSELVGTYGESKVTLIPRVRSDVPPIWVPGFNPVIALDVYDHVLNNAGVKRLYENDADEVVVGNVEDNTGSLSHQVDWPDLSPEALEPVFSIPDNPWDVLSNGKLRIEEAIEQHSSLVMNEPVNVFYDPELVVGKEPQPEPQPEPGDPVMEPKLTFTIEKDPNMDHADFLTWLANLDGNWQNIIEAKVADDFEPPSEPPPARTKATYVFVGGVLTEI